MALNTSRQARPFSQISKNILPIRSQLNRLKALQLLINKNPVLNDIQTLAVILERNERTTNHNRV